MEKLDLAAQQRTETGKELTALRRAGFVPGIVYGHGVDNVMVKVKETLFKKVFSQGGENTLVDLAVDGEEKPYTVLIQDVARHPVKSSPVHVDFYVVNLKETVRTEIPLTIVGVSPAVKELEGTLIQPMHSVEVESLPMDIPHEIEVDISGLVTFEDHITVADLSVGENVEILAEPGDIVASVQEPRSEEELEELEEEVVEDVSDVEGVEDEEEREEGEEGEMESPAPEQEKGQKEEKEEGGSDEE